MLFSNGLGELGLGELGLGEMGGHPALMYVQISYSVSHTYVSANRPPVIRTYVNIIVLVYNCHCCARLK